MLPTPRERRFAAGNETGMKSKTGTKIRILYLDGCPSYEPAVATVRDVVKEQNLEAEIELVRVTSKEQAVTHRFFGSPTVQINGVDIEDLNARTRAPNLCCRLYNEGGALRGWPSRAMIREALVTERNEVKNGV
jgi:hypothetical protein